MILKKLKLAEVVEIKGGGTPKRNIPVYWNGRIPWATVKDLKSPFISSTEENISKEGVSNSATNLLPAGTIIIATRMGLGKVAVNEVPMAINQDLKGLMVKNNFDSRFLFHFLNSKPAHISSFGKGATVKGVTLDVIRNLEVPVYPLKEQRRIASILDKADQIRRKRKESIQLMDQFLQSVFIEMFGDPIRNSKKWMVCSLGELLEFITSGSRGWAKYYSESGSKFLRIQNVGYNELKLNDLAYVNVPNTVEGARTKIKSGDILLSITADLGRTAVATDIVEGAFINQHLALLRVRGIVPEFLSAYFATAGGQNLIQQGNKGGVKAGLNFNDIRRLKICLPPRELQEKYKLIECRIRSFKDDLLEMAASIDNLFVSITQRAFRGELCNE